MVRLPFGKGGFVSLHHFATRCDTGPCVAYLRPHDGAAVVMVECMSQAQAQVLADQHNQRAAQDAARLNAWINRPGEVRRRVRYFPTESDD